MKINTKLGIQLYQLIQEFNQSFLLLCQKKFHVPLFNITDNQSQNISQSSTARQEDQSCKKPGRLIFVQR